MTARSLSPARPRRFTPFQLAVHAGAWLPLVWLGGRALTGHLTANPVQAAIQFTGRTALTLLTLSLACTPLAAIFGFGPAAKVRRPLGLYAFLYAAGHFLLFSGVDYQFNLEFIWADVKTKAYFWLGLAAGLILLALAVTSLPEWKRRLGKNWRRLHRLNYAASVLVILHYGLAQKGDLFALRGNILQPVLYGGAIGLLLVLRVPPVARGARHLWQRLR